MGAVTLSVVALGALAQLFGNRGFPKSWNVGLAEPINNVQSWIRDNRSDHWLFTWFFHPLTDLVSLALDSVTSFISWFPWFVAPIVVFAIIARTGRWRSGLLAACAVIYPGVVGVWPQSIETISLMAVAVAISVIIGLPLGVWTAMNSRVERTLRPVLDAMQTVPATVYLIPVVLVFGIGQVPAAIATVIYALPPVVRCTALGIKQVPPAAVEASQMFGATRRQTLLRVQMPLAVPSIITGINQTVMMALGIVVIATLVGAAGLGQEIMQTVRLLSPGRGLVVGLAVVAVALVLDRLSGALIVTPGSRQAKMSWRVVVLFIIGVAVVSVTSRVIGVHNFPFSWGTSFADPVDSFVRWFRDTFDVITRPFNDFVVRELLIRSRDILNSTLTWQFVVVAATTLALFVAGWKLAIATAGGLVVIGITGMWGEASNTLAQTIVAVVISILIALPVGIWMGRRPRAEAALSPLLDSLQTIPPLIYAIPFVMIFTVGPVPGVLAAVVYSIPPGIRLTSLGIRQVNAESIEAATTFGATQRQVLWGVRIPLAMPSIILAINQMVMMVLAMAIIAGMVGGEGLGYRSVEALTRSNTGLGAEVGLAIVIMATILDRLTQAAAHRMQAPASV
jgi:glycine betaine/proline transport system permease protein